MKWNVTYDRDLGIVHAEQWESFSLNEEFEFLQMIAEDADATRGAPLLIDYRQLTISDISRDNLDDISVRMSGLIDKLRSHRIALLARSDLQFGLGRQFQMIAEQRVPAPIEVFRDEAEAVAWLREPLRET